MSFRSDRAAAIAVTVGILGLALFTQGALAASPYTQRTTHRIALTIDETASTALFDDDSSGQAPGYSNGYTAINDYHDPAAADMQFFAPGNRSFKLDISSGQKSESVALSCGMYGGKDSSLSTTGAPFFLMGSSTADATLKCATPSNQLYELTYTDCVEVRSTAGTVGGWPYTFTPAADCTPRIKNGRKIVTGVSVPFSVTAVQL